MALVQVPPPSPPPSPTKRHWPGSWEQPTLASGMSQLPQTPRAPTVFHPFLLPGAALGHRSADSNHSIYKMGDPFSRQRPCAGLGCGLGTHVHTHTSLGLLTPGQTSPAAPPSMGPVLPLSLVPKPRAETLESPSALPSPSRFISNLSPSPPAQSYL